MLEDPFAGVETDNILPVFAHEVIRGRTIADTHLKALKDILWYRKSTQTVTEDGEKIIEVGPRTYVVDDISTDRYLSILPYSENFLDEYTDKFLNGYPEGTNFEYDYHSRLYDYPFMDDLLAMYGKCNQIQVITDKLIKNANTRRAVAVTWKPEIDFNKKDVPCLQYIQCLVRNDSLHMNVVFRSNDMLMAFGNNVYALTELQKKIRDVVSEGIDQHLHYGYYSHTVMSPHIYYERDRMEYEKMLYYLYGYRFA